MTLSRRAWIDYINKLRRCNEAAAQAMSAYLAAHGTADTQGIIEYAYAVASKYGEASAALAAEMYDATAALAAVHIPPAAPAEAATYQEVSDAIKRASKYQNPKTISREVARLVKQAGADTTVQNAARDGAEWAWVPNGDTCAFCLSLASRGWQPASKKALKGNHAQHIHANCDCAYAIRFDSESELRGYDPEKYQEIYYNAEGKNSTARINYIRRQNYKANRGEINAQKRAAYAERKAREAGEKALVKAEKNGIITAGELAHRKTGENGREIINKAVYSKITNAAMKRGADVVTATPENGLLRYLEARGATAVTIDDLIIFRPDATTTEVLEEIYHFDQNRRGLNKQYGALQRTIMNEIDAQEYLIRVADKYKIPIAEREETRALLESYKKQMEELKKAGEWIDNN